MISFKSLRKNILSERNLLDYFEVDGDKVAITEELSVYVNDKLIVENANNLEDAREYAIDYIQFRGNASHKIPDQTLLEAIEKHHEVKVTNKLIESYNNLIESKEFTIDPVVRDLKTYDEFGKFEFYLKDGSCISLSEDIHEKLSLLLKDKYDIVDYMKESVDNFKKVVREIRK